MSFVFRPEDYPSQPGCYLMKDSGGRILYVGKSINLRSRLRSYFTGRPDRRKLQLLVREIAEIEVVLVHTEAESFLLENNLIKIHKPPCNRALIPDNSGYAYLRLTGERLPRLELIYRNPRHSVEESRNGTGQRLGPYRNTSFLEAMLTFVTEYYGLRTCETMPRQVCLLYHIDRCSGICEGKITEEDYRERARQAAMLFDNQGHRLMEILHGKMEACAARLEFEKAQQLLQYIRLLEQTPDRQIVDSDADLDQDVLYFGEGRVMVAKVRRGLLQDFRMHELVPDYGEASCDEFLLARYGEDRPDELIVSTIHDAKRVRALLNAKDKHRKPVKITQPRRGIKFRLLQLCKENYEYQMNRNGTTYQHG